MKTVTALLLSLIASVAMAHPEHDFDDTKVPVKVEADAAAKAAAEKARVDAEAAKAAADKAAAAKAVKKP